MLAEIAVVGDVGGVVVFGGRNIHEIFRVLAVEKRDGAAVGERGEIGNSEGADVAHVGVEGPRRGEGGEGAGRSDRAVGVEDVSARTDVAVDEVGRGVLGLAVFLGPLAAELKERREAPREDVFRVGLAGVDFGEGEAPFLVRARVGVVGKVGPIGTARLDNRPLGGVGVGTRGPEIGGEGVERFGADRAAGGRLVIVFRT